MKKLVLTLMALLLIGGFYCVNKSIENYNNLSELEKIEREYSQEPTFIFAEHHYDYVQEKEWVMNTYDVSEKYAVIALNMFNKTYSLKAVEDFINSIKTQSAEAEEVTTGDIKYFVNKAEIGEAFGSIEVTSTYYYDNNSNDVVDDGELIRDDAMTRYTSQSAETKVELKALLESDMKAYAESLIKKDNREYIEKEMIATRDSLVTQGYTVTKDTIAVGKVFKRDVMGQTMEIEVVEYQMYKDKRGKSYIGLVVDISCEGVKVKRDLFNFVPENTDTKATFLAKINTRVQDKLEEIGLNDSFLDTIKEDILKVKGSTNSVSIDYKGKVINVTTDKTNSVVDAVVSE